MLKEEVNISDALSDNHKLLSQLGDVYRLTQCFHDSKSFVSWTEENFGEYYIKYNLEKKIERYGLNLTSLEGKLDDRLALDSLGEYNKKNGTTYTESDFNVKTPAYENEDLKQCVKDFEPYLTRTHVLKLEPGGYFPPHRDWGAAFRLIVPLQNCDTPYVYFMLDGKPIEKFSTGYVHFVNTHKEHVLFNASFKPSYWLIMNVNPEEQAIRNVFYNLQVS